MTETFGQRLERLIKAKGYQRLCAFAQEAGISKCAVTNYIYETRMPKADSLFRMAQALGKTMDELWIGEEEEPT